MSRVPLSVGEVKRTFCQGFVKMARLENPKTLFKVHALVLVKAHAMFDLPERLNESIGAMNLLGPNFLLSNPTPSSEYTV